MSWRMVICGCLLSLAVPAGLTEAIAQPAESWVGNEVMVTAWEAELKAGEETVGRASLGEVYKVAREQGPWLWIEERRGWIERSDVVPSEQAVEYFSEQVRQSNSAEAYHKRGAMWLARNDPEKAAEDYTQAIRTEPQNPVLYNERGNVYRRLGEYDKAIDDFNTAILNDLKHPVVYTNRGLAWLDKGDPEKALADFGEAVQLDARFAPAWEAGGNARLAQGNYDKARANFEKAIEADPEFPVARNNLAWLLATAPSAEHRDGATAVLHAMKACELTGFQDPGYLDTLAAAYAEVGQFEEAVKRAEEALQLAPPEQKEGIQERLALYREGRPYRQGDRTGPPPAPAAP